MSSKRNGDSSPANLPENESPTCFVIMPITDPDGYEPGHFQHVFDDLFVPACAKAGYHALRADQVRETNMIHLDVLQRILDSPMVLCDLSSRNPNVLFELGLRQAFDKPVAIVQEFGTPQIFDITPLRFTNYRRDLIYHQALQDQDSIATALKATKQATGDTSSVNSIVRLLGLTHPASRTSITEGDRDSAMLQVIMAELANLRSEVRAASLRSDVPSGIGSLRTDTPDWSLELHKLRIEFDEIAFNVDNLVHDVIPAADFSDDLAQFESRLKVLMITMSDAPKRYKDAALSMRDRLRGLQSKHDQYLRSANLPQALPLEG